MRSEKNRKNQNPENRDYLVRESGSCLGTYLILLQVIFFKLMFLVYKKLTLAIEELNDLVIGRGKDWFSVLIDQPSRSFVNACG